MSVLRAVRKRKKVRKLGRVEIMRREDYADLELDAKVELIRSLVPLGLMHVEELLDEEVMALAGERYARKAAAIGGRRHGTNPGTVGLAGQRVPIRVPRIRGVAGSEIPLRSYAALHGDRAVNDLLLRRVLYGISCRNYEAAAEAIPGAIGLTGSTVSRGFIQARAAQLRELQERDLSREDVVAVVEPPRVSERLHFLGGWSPWEDRGSTHRRFESGRSGWCSTTNISTTRSGRRSGQWRRRSGARRRRSATGSGRPSVISAVVRG